MARSEALDRIDRKLGERFGVHDARSALRRACALLLAEAGQARPPVRLKSVLRRMQVDIVYHEEQAGEEVASLTFGDGRVRLVIAKGQFLERPRRARFSIAHEIGHLIVLQALGAEGLDLGEGDAEAYAEMERLCDFAASHLLMPREQLAAAVRQRGIGRAANPRFGHSLRRVARSLVPSDQRPRPRAEPSASGAGTAGMGARH